MLKFIVIIILIMPLHMMAGWKIDFVKKAIKAIFYIETKENIPVCTKIYVEPIATKKLRKYIAKESIKPIKILLNKNAKKLPNNQKVLILTDKNNYKWSYESGYLFVEGSENGSTFKYKLELKKIISNDFNQNSISRNKVLNIFENTSKLITWKEQTQSMWEEVYLKKCEKKYIVKKGDTLNSIANKLKSEDYTLEEYIEILYKNNYSSFVGGNKNKLQIGAILIYNSCYNKNTKRRSDGYGFY